MMPKIVGSSFNFFVTLQRSWRGNGLCWGATRQK